MPLGIIGAITLGGIIIILLIVAIILIILYFDNQANKSHEPSSKKEYGFWELLFTPEHKKAGIRGEEAVIRAIESVLREDDELFTNVNIEYDGKQTELDNVIVNKYGVFIIEVKNYVGYIVGNEDEYEWEKYKTTYSGNTYKKTVNNPFKQVKRQIYILSNYLDYYGSKVWIKGYVILLNDNSPIESEHLLKSIDDIDCAIHTSDRKMLDKKTLENIKKLLSY